MTQARLPDGFAVQVDRRVRVLGDGSALLGGSPTRLLRLAPAAQDLLSDGRLKVLAVARVSSGNWISDRGWPMVKGRMLVLGILGAPGAVVAVP